jgi:hypothetical protein
MASWFGQVFEGVGVGVGGIGGVVDWVGVSRSMVWVVHVTAAPAGEVANELATCGVRVVVGFE